MKSPGHDRLTPPSLETSAVANHVNSPLYWNSCQDNRLLECASTLVNLIFGRYRWPQRAIVQRAGSGRSEDPTEVGGPSRWLSSESIPRLCDEALARTRLAAVDRHWYLVRGSP